MIFCRCNLASYVIDAASRNIGPSDRSDQSRCIDLSVGRRPGPDWRRRHGRLRARWTRFDGTRTVHQWNFGGVPSAVAMLLGWSDATPPPATRDIDDDDDDDEWS